MRLRFGEPLAFPVACRQAHIWTLRGRQMPFFPLQRKRGFRFVDYLFRRECSPFIRAASERVAPAFVGRRTVRFHDFNGAETEVDRHQACCKTAWIEYNTKTHIHMNIIGFETNNFKTVKQTA